MRFNLQTPCQLQKCSLVNHQTSKNRIIICFSLIKLNNLSKENGLITSKKADEVINFSINESLNNIESIIIKMKFEKLPISLNLCD